MMTTYNTGNPVPSSAVKDLYDNSQTEDEFVNGDNTVTVTRTGKLIKTMAGMNQDAADAIASLGFQFIGDYAAGLTVGNYNQIFRYLGEFYKAAPTTSLPYTMTGTPATDIPLFRSVGDATLRTALAATTGAGLVGFDPTLTYPGGTVGSEIKPVDSVFALLSEPVASGKNKAVSSYHTGWAASASLDPKGGGLFTYDASMLKSRHDGGLVISPTVPWDGTQANLAAFLAGTGETLPGGSGCWVRVAPRSSVLEYGARADNTTNDIASFQKALDSIRRVNVPNASYSMTGTILFKTNGCCLIGESMTDTKLNFTGAGPVLQNPDNATITKLFCELRDLNINAPASGNSSIVNWKSMQFGVIDRVWILGQPILGNTTLVLEATWITTECTYNEITRCYMGNTATCIRVGDGANNNTVSGSRFQPGGTMPGPTQLLGAIGILLSATAAERISNFNIHDNGFEYPFQISTGINVLQNCNGVFIKGNRFEQLLNGIVVGATGNRHISGTNRKDNYFDSCLTNINLSTGAKSAAQGLIAAGAYTGVGALTQLGESFGMTGIRTGVGTYAFTFDDGALPNNGYVLQVSASQPITAISKTTSGFSIITQNVSVANTDTQTLDIAVFYNQ